GPNVRLDFDGVLLRHRAPDASVTDALAFFNVNQRRGGFDNDTDEETGFWGLYHSRPLSSLPQSIGGRPVFLDLYYFGELDDGPPFVNAAGTELRHSFGSRLWVGGRPGTPGVSGDVETVIQFGEIELAGGPGELDIFSYSFTGAAEYTFDAPLEPTTRLRFGITGGDDDASDGTLGTFRNLVNTGRVFGDLTPIGPGNLFGFQPELDLRLDRKTNLTLGTRHFWRVSTEDGIYARGQFPLRGPLGDDRYVGTIVNATATRALAPGISLTAEAGAFFAGSYLEDNPPAEDTLFAAVDVKIRL
ncbi:MAG: alginate export family protein, partial [Planctomycetota bacterium]